MKAVILCGGRGTRLQNETEYRPKPLVEIGGMPILWHIMKIYSQYGVKDFVLCLGYKGHMIKDFFMDLDVYSKDMSYNTHTKQITIHDTSPVDDWNIVFAETGLDTNTGARVKRIEKYITEDDFFLTYGDGLADVNVKELYEYHKRHKKIGTVTAVRPLARFGVLSIDDEKIMDFTKKHIMHSNRIDGGFFVFKREFFKFLWEKKDCVLEEEPLKKLVKENQFTAYKHDGFWQCMDIPQHADLLNAMWDAQDAPWKTW